MFYCLCDRIHQRRRRLRESGVLGLVHSVRHICALCHAAAAAQMVRRGRHNHGQLPPGRNYHQQIAGQDGTNHILDLIVFLCYINACIYAHINININININIHRRHWTRTACYSKSLPILFCTRRLTWLACTPNTWRIGASDWPSSRPTRPWSTRKSPKRSCSALKSYLIQVSDKYL